MNRTEIIEAIAERTGVTKIATSKVLDAFVEISTEALRDGKNVKVSAFGTFSPRKREEKKVRNPYTGEMMTAKPANVVRFSPSKILKDSIN